MRFGRQMSETMLLLKARKPVDPILCLKGIQGFRGGWEREWAWQLLFDYQDIVETCLEREHCLSTQLMCLNLSLDYPITVQKEFVLLLHFKDWDSVSVM